MGEKREIISSEKKLSDYIPKQLPHDSLEIKEGQSTMGHIAYKLKIDKKWLQENLMNQNNTSTISISSPGKAGKIEEKYFWGEPRMGDEYALIQWDGRHQLYRKRGNTLIFMSVPNEKVEPFKKQLHLLAKEIVSPQSA